MDTLAAKIVSDLLNALKKPIIEYEITPVQEQMYNKCPIILTPGEDGHYLAIESWCIPHIYTYCSNKLLSPSKSNGISAVKLLDETVDELSKVLVLLNGDFATAWNRRRQLLINGQLDPHHELHLSKLILQRKPKSPESITYRQFVIKKCLFKLINCDALIELLGDELNTALKIASSYRCNYYAWTYRWWLFEQIFSRTSNKEEFFNCELKQIHTWIEKNISDSSGYHYLQQLRLKQVTLNSQLINQVINDEMQRCQSLLTLYPTQEALILHRKFSIRLAKLFLPQFAFDSLVINEINFITSHQANLNNGTETQVIARYQKYLETFSIKN